MNLFSKIQLITFFTLILFLTPGCKFEHEVETPEDAEHAFVLLHLRPLNSSTRTDVDENEVSELIKSLRIIMIDESTGSIECNDFLDKDDLNPNPSNQEDLYSFVLLTTPGLKNFYLFANEESVGSVSRKSDPPSNRSTLNSILNSYPVGSVLRTEDENSFEEIINSLYFYPSYQIEDRNIYLPYSCYYEARIESGSRHEQSMWLVPVATKYHFNFTNNRSETFEISKLEITGQVERNYVLGNVGNDQHTMKIEEKEYYWVDWLAEIYGMSQEQTSFSSNVDFNEKYGWITDYNLPFNSFASYQFKKDNESLKIPARTDNTGGYLPTPGKKTFGPYYLPETKYIPDKKENNQRYYLSLTLKDTANGAEKEFEPIELTNLGSLFRNTHVVVNITLNEGTDEIYVEIRSWNQTQNIYGTANKQS